MKLMNWRGSFVIGCLLAAMASFAATNAVADEMQFNLEWAPLGTFNTGSMSGTAVIDTDVLQGVGSFFDEPIANTGFTSIEVNVQGTGAGDGFYSSANGDITTLIWQVGGPVDFSSELIGQANLNDFNLGQFPPGNAPFGVAPFTTQTSGGADFLLTSFIVVPEPASATVCLVLATAAFILRRRN